MSLFDNLSECAMISKAKLNKAIKGIPQGLSFFEEQTNCISCPFAGYPDEVVKEKCNEFCPYKETVISPKKVYLAEKKKVLINDKAEKSIIKMPFVVYNNGAAHLPKSAIKLYLLYHFFPKDSLGIIRNVNLSIIADMLGICLSSVKRLNDLLNSVQYVHVTCIHNNICNIYIYDLDELKSESKDGGSGYITMSKTDLLHFLGIKNINLLRADIKKILRADLDRNVKNKKISEITISSFKEVFPFYLRKGQKGIEKLLSHEDSIYKVSNIDFKENMFEMDISKFETKDTLRNNLKTSLYQKLDDFIKLNDICIYKNEQEDTSEDTRIDTHSVIKEMEHNDNKEYEKRLNDLTQLSIEYGFTTVCSMLLRIKRRYLIGEGFTISNIGGFVRQQILDFISIRGSFLNMAS